MKIILKNMLPIFSDKKVSYVLSLLFLLTPTAYAEIAQTPLLLGSSENIPGNLVLTPSAEYPTVISVANLGEYKLTGKYAGYFDSDKCYDYKRENIVHPKFGAITGGDGGGYFTPVSTGFTVSKNCGGKWSGHYLNWAATQTIDPFRKALTGGYRVVDTSNQTILEKATRGGVADLFPDGSVDVTIAKKVSPYSVNNMISISNSVTSFNNARGQAQNVKDYQKNKTISIGVQVKVDKNISTIQTEYFSVRVEVCKIGFLESNCKQYGNHYKPEGLLQEYADDIRYSVFSYLNINGNNVDGGVLRAPQDYIGPKRREPGVAGVSNNVFQEWDPQNGTLKVNPRGDVIGNSGAINYINKFGEISNQLKSNDPVSELYYAALRYMRNVGNLDSYTKQADTDLKKDYFPVITAWVDPIQYSCQKNAILGIGDVNTHYDRNLLPSDKKLPSYDNDFMNPAGLNGYTDKVFSLEGIGKKASNVFTTNNNSAYIAGLAYFANTEDIRPDMDGKQKVSTYWVDVRENAILKPKADNQYWLAAKYGGFKVPNSYVYGQALQDSWWHTSGDILSPTNDKRPDNFYVASDAEAMVESLRQAFEQIATTGQDSTTAPVASSPRLEKGSAVFSASVNAESWSGDLSAFEIGDNSLSSQPVWSAAKKLDAISNNDIDGRNVISIKYENKALLNAGINFKWNELASEQKSYLDNKEDILKYLRGDRSKERTDANPSGTLRSRASRLGDIVNSDPQFVHQQNYGYQRLQNWKSGTSTVAEKYKEFRESDAYKARVPMVVVGANDGMLHAYDARLDGNGGKELFAFVPNGVYANLKQLADINYVHRYYVDGTPGIADAWLGDKWATVAVGVSGAGGKSVFALNITDVKNSNSVTKGSVMWEFTDPDMGYNMGQPAIVALPNQKFGVLISSGYHDTAPQKGYIWILDIKDGSVLKKLELNTTGNLGGVLATDLNGDREADRLYVADTLGQVWRADLSIDNNDNLVLANTLGTNPLIKVVDAKGAAQAITAPLVSAFNKYGQPMLLFGTGSFYRVGDNEIATNPQIESLYGVVDTGKSIVGRSSLLQQKITLEKVQSDQTLRAVSDNKLTSQQGWYLDLAWTASPSQNITGAKGERVLAQANVFNRRVTFTSMTPVNDPCASGGTSMLMTLDLTSGSRLSYDYLELGSEEPIWSGFSSSRVAKGVIIANGKIVSGTNSDGYKGDIDRDKPTTTLQSWRQVR